LLEFAVDIRLKYLWINLFTRAKQAVRIRTNSQLKCACLLYSAHALK